MKYDYVQQHEWILQILWAIKPDSKEYILYGFIYRKLKKAIFNYKFTREIVERREKVIAVGDPRGGPSGVLAIFYVWTWISNASLSYLFKYFVIFRMS